MVSDAIFRESQSFLLNKFGVVPRNSVYFFYDDFSWLNFCDLTNLNKLVEGVFFPRGLVANLKKDSSFLLPNFFHEYFAHGLYCEYSLPGRELVRLELDLMKLEQDLLREDFSNFRLRVLYEEYEYKKKGLEIFFNSNVESFEGHAVWLEYLLSKNVGVEGLFFEKLKTLPSSIVGFFEKFHSYSSEFGDFALNSALGFPKFYDGEVLEDLLRRKFKEDFSTIDLALVYGSMKPYSDIDLFIVSDVIKSERSHWLDVYAVSKAELVERVKSFDVSVSEAVFTGDVVVGSFDFLNHLKKLFLDGEITSKAIDYNISFSNYQFRVAKTYPFGSCEQRIASSYAKTYMRNAVELSKGNKLFVFKNNS